MMQLTKKGCCLYARLVPDTVAVLMQVIARFVINVLTLAHLQNKGYLTIIAFNGQNAIS
jgi:hypothetical protein